MAVLSAFNPHEFSEATIRTVATGREGVLDRILATIRDNLGARTLQHLILSAPRGYGKSFMMRHIQLEVERIAREEGLSLAVVLMPEEMPHVKEPETLIRELTRTLTGGSGAQAELTWHEDDGEAWETALADLRAAIREKVGPDGLCVALVENFDQLLRRAFPKEVQASRLRQALGEEGRLMLIAASASGAFDRSYDDRLFQAFHEVVLEPWSVEDCLVFFDRQRREAGQAPLDDVTRARARAVATFIGGTPRLATLLGLALFDADVLHAADLLQRLVDELTPYYKERIEALPGRSQKLLDALIRSGEPATQSEVARRVNATSQAAIAGPFNDLARERVVVGERAPDSAEVLYRVADRVFAHYYRRRIVAHGRATCPLEALVDLLANFFSPEEKRAKVSEFARMGRLPEARLMARLHEVDLGITMERHSATLARVTQLYIPDHLIPLASETTGERLRSIGALVGEGHIDKAHEKIEDSLKTTTNIDDRVIINILRSIIDVATRVDHDLATATRAVALAQSTARDTLLLTAELALAWCLYRYGRHDEGLNLSQSIAIRAEKIGASQIEATALRYAIYGLDRLDRHEEAVAAAERAVLRARQTGNERAEIAALSYSAHNLACLDRYEQAVSMAEQSTELALRTGHGEWEVETLCDTAYSLRRLNRLEQALCMAEYAAAQAHRTRDIYGEAEALLQATQIYRELDRHDQALAAAERAAILAHQIGEIETEIGALHQAAFNLEGLHRYEDAASVARQAADLAYKAEFAQEYLICAGFAAFYFAIIGNLNDYLDIVSHKLAFLDKNGDYALENEVDIIESTNNIIFADYIEKSKDIAFLNKFLIRISEALDLDGTRRACFVMSLRALVERTLTEIDDPMALAAWAEAISLHFPGRFTQEESRLQAASRYHAGNRDPSALARLDPDLRQSLITMFPPEPSETEQPKRVRKKPAPRRKR